MADEPSSGQRVSDQRFADGLEWARWAVGRWSGFPVDEVPRPLVIVGERVFVEDGFKTGEAKMAFIDGRIECRVEVPDEVRSQLEREPGHGQHRPRATLLIADAERGEAEFVTDRGPRRMSAWRLRAEEALGPIWVLDPEVADWQPSGEAGGARPDVRPPIAAPGLKVEIGADERTLTLYWLGAAPEYERYLQAEAIESDQAVALVAHGEDMGWTGIRRAIGHVHQVPARLREPLGARVFVDLHGSARQVTKLG